VKRATDANSTQKISREQLDEALKRTKSGTRRAVRSDPALPEPEVVDFLGPRDDTAPQFAHIDPSSLSPIRAAAPAPVEAPVEASVLRDEPVEVVALVAAVEVIAPVAVAVVAPVERVEPVEQVALPAPPRDTSLRLNPRTAFVVGLAIAALMVLAALVGFFAGRNPQH
jgi:hypothetical protein